MAVRRPLYVIAQKNLEATLLVGSVAVGAPHLMFSWTLNLPFVPPTPITGRLGVEFVLSLVRPQAGVHLYARLGGSPTDSVGIATAEVEFVSAGAQASARLELDVSTLFVGRSAEYLKVFGYYDPTSGTAPGIDSFSVVLTGDPEDVEDDRAVIQYEIDRSYEASGADEQLLYEWCDDQASIDSAAARIALAAVVKTDAGTGRFRVRIGGTPGGIDGAIAAEIETTSTAWENRLAIGYTLNTGAPTLIKLTGLVEGGASARIRGGVITARETA